MPTLVSMPGLEPVMNAGRIIGWLKQVGETVQQGEPMVQIECEMVVKTLAAPASGIVNRLMVQQGESVEVDAALAIILAPGEKFSAEQIDLFIRKESTAWQLPMLPHSQPVSSEPSFRSRPTVRINASPAARKLARDLNVDLTAVAGTGPGGMIGREDVLRAIQTANTEPEEPEDLAMDFLRATL